MALCAKMNKPQQLTKKNSRKMGDIKSCVKTVKAYRKSFLLDVIFTPLLDSSVSLQAPLFFCIFVLITNIIHKTFWS